MNEQQLRRNFGRIAATFAEWQRRWQENPDDFLSCDEHFEQPPATYGERAARYFIRIFATVEAAPESPPREDMPSRTANDDPDMRRC